MMITSGSPALLLRIAIRMRILRIWLPFLLILTGFQLLYAQPGPGSDTPPAAPMAPASIRPLLVDVEFNGNSALGDELIQAEIVTRPTRTSAIMKVFSLIGQLVERNPLAPQRHREQVRKTIDSLGGDFRYLNMNAVQADTARIVQLYNDFGYHDAIVTYRVALDTIRNTSLVRFMINEGPAYPVKGVHYFGLENVPASIREEVTEPIYLKDGETYTKERYVAQAEHALDVLRNNGYAFAGRAEPVVITAREPAVEKRFDSVLAYIYTGERYKFGTTIVEPDAFSDSKPVDTTLVQDQREYQPGEWYSKRQVDQTIANIYALGTFELVTLDTLTPFSSDSVLGMKISTRLRDQNDLRLAPEISFERRPREYITNLGFSVAYTRLNLLGRAEQLSTSLRVLTPMRNLITKDFWKEFQGGGAVSFAVPSAVGFPFIGGKRLSWLLTTGYDVSVLDRIRGEIGDFTLRSERITGAGELAYRFPEHTYLTLVSGRLSYQYNKYTGIGPYSEQIALRRINEDIKDTSACKPDEILPLVQQALLENLYRVQVLQGDDIELLDPVRDARAREQFDALKRTLILSGTAVADNRNDLFSPSDGYFMELRMELGATGALVHGFPGGFLKTEFSYRRFVPLNPAWIGAIRGHAGYIQEFGEFSLTPSSSRFSAGGANSLRGWYVRDMLATRPTEVATLLNEACAAPIVQNIVSENRRLLGGLALIELNAELRWKPFLEPRASTLGRQLNQMILIFFVDAGNAYFRDREDVMHFNVGDILSNIGFATGFSIGYETPVGPFRFGLGFPIYDPVNQVANDPGKRWIFRRNIRDAAVLHVGIGHAF